jgi:serine/threonine protein kinase/Tol biopolymer transport system component
MAPDRWRQITEVFHAALACDATRRDAFLDQACAADPALRSEVESLMAARHQAGDFGNTPVCLPGASLEPGASIGPYRIGQLLGVGGMGEVYRARDSKLGRDVAIKVLPPHLTSNPERLVRFEREARLLASLNDPHIGAIYGVEESDGRRALVMELVEGEDLSQRIARGPIPLIEALPVARQIAEALEAAHEHGIVHRDLKPANVKLRDDGVAKVLDFGLAKVIEPTSSADEGPVSGPTPPVHATDAGTIVGTAAYMSPEQARGKAADKRADVWAFGVVFFEMLNGRPLFTGETAAETLASVIGQEPDVETLPPGTPAAIRALIGRCLTKDPRNRLQAIGEARIAIERAIAQFDAPESFEARQRTAASTPRPLWHRALPWAFAAVAFGGAGLAFWAPRRTTAPRAPLRLTAELGVDASLATGPVDALAMSPDGTTVAFVARKDALGPAQLYVRPINQLEATALRGTDDASSPFFSPDGQWVAFFSRGALKKVSIAGGAAITVCDAPNGRGGHWAEDGTIVFSPDSQPLVELLRVSSAGGTPEPLTSSVEGEHWQRWPQLLPGGKAVLYTGDGAPGDATHANLVVQPLPSGPRKIVQRGAYHGRYLPSGHLVWIQNGALVAARFDLDKAEVTSKWVTAALGVASDAGSGAAQFAVSSVGTLVYLQGPSPGGAVPIHWLHPDGKTTMLRSTPANWFNLALAPDGRRLALQISTEGQNDIWIYDWTRDTLTRATTTEGAVNTEPIWTPDGSRIAFASRSAAPAALNIYWKHADGTGDTLRLTDSENRQLARSWHPSGRFLAFEEQTSATNWDLMVLPLHPGNASEWKPGQPSVFLDSPAVERKPMFSPDGRWLAYDSDESGRQEVYVRPFPGPGGKWRISSDGGTFGTWSRTKQEIFYGRDGQIMVAPYTADGDSFRAEPPKLVPNARYTVRGQTRMFDLHPDGKRFALAAAPEALAGGKQDRVVFVFDFFEELRRIVPGTNR